MVPSGQLKVLLLSPVTARGVARKSGNQEETEAVVALRKLAARHRAAGLRDAHSELANAGPLDQRRWPAAATRVESQRLNCLTPTEFRRNEETTRSTTRALPTLACSSPQTGRGASAQNSIAMARQEGDAAQLSELRSGSPRRNDLLR